MVERIEENPMNRRRPENRWKRILRDADHEQESVVRTWLNFARHFFDKDQSAEDEFLEAVDSPAKRAENDSTAKRPASKVA